MICAMEQKSSGAGASGGASVTAGVRGQYERLRAYNIKSAYQT